jgi:hypothetical protein
MIEILDGTVQILVEALEDAIMFQSIAADTKGMPEAVKKNQRNRAILYGKVLIQLRGRNNRSLRPAGRPKKFGAHMPNECRGVPGNKLRKQ